MFFDEIINEYSDMPNIFLTLQERGYL